MAQGPWYGSRHCAINCRCRMNCGSAWSNFLLEAPVRPHTATVGTGRHVTRCRTPRRPYLTRTSTMIRHGQTSWCSTLALEPGRNKLGLRSAPQHGSMKASRATGLVSYRIGLRTRARKSVARPCRSSSHRLRALLLGYVENRRRLVQIEGSKNQQHECEAKGNNKAVTTAFHNNAL